MERSPLKGLYEEAARKAELWSVWISMFALKIIPVCGVILMVITTTVLYSGFNLGSDSFILAAPMW